MTPLEKMQALETILKTLFEHIQWQGNVEIIELASEALTKVTELQEQEKLIAEIF